MHNTRLLSLVLACAAQVCAAGALAAEPVQLTLGRTTASRRTG